MADKKISALTASTTPLAGTEVLPIVQSGSTVKVSVADLTAGRAVAASSVTVAGVVKIGPSPTDGINIFKFGTSSLASVVYGDTATGDIIITDPSGNGNFKLTATGDVAISKAGRGIDFSANANAPGMTSELLKWYEEGAWTPVISSAAGAITSYSVNSASYTRIGRRVVVDFDITITNNGTGAAGINITGVPFTVATAYASCGSFREVAATGFGGFIIASSGTNLQASNYDNAYAGGTNYRLVGTFSYNA